MFDSFERRRIATSGAEINLVVGGHGPPLLLLHGYPQTHVMWHAVAPRLATEFTVVAPDLRGYGESAKPPGGDDHSGYSKRTMALDQVEVMARLGFERFSVAGHDRGGRVAYRMALDHPERVEKLAVLDIVPTHTMFTRVDRARAMGAFHWYLLAQPPDLPERLIGADPVFWLRTMLPRWGNGSLEPFGQEALAAYERFFSDPACIHVTCEDYRAGATIDLALDEQDYGRKQIACPVLAIWGGIRDRWRQIDVLATWREWAEDVRGEALACGHFLPEEAPEETYIAMREFFIEQGGSS